MLRILLFSAKVDLKYQAWKIFNDHYHSDATSRTTINFRLKNLRKIVRDGWIRFFLKSLKISESPCKRVCSFNSTLITHHILNPYWFAYYDLKQGSARAVPRYPWVPGYRPVPIEILKIWVPLGTGYRENLRNWVPLGTGYRANFRPWVPLGTGYRENLRNWVPLSTGYRANFRNRVPMGTGYRPEKKILASDGYRVPEKFSLMPTPGWDGYPGFSSWKSHDDWIEIFNDY